MCTVGVSEKIETILHVFAQVLGNISSVSSDCQGTVTVSKLYEYLSFVSSVYYYQGHINHKQSCKMKLVNSIREIKKCNLSFVVAIFHHIYDCNLLLPYIGSIALLIGYLTYTNRT